MKDFLKKIFSKSNEDIDLSLEYSDSIYFTLKIKDIDVGYLTSNNNMWTFKYSDEFKKQKSYRRLAGFSDLNKNYQSEMLWPFFKIRIPGLKQPMIKEIIEKENLNKENEGLLLRRFGRVTMSNPYILEPN